MKVLHVVQIIDRWSVETWLVQMLAHARLRGVDVDWTFYCSSPEPGAKDELVRAMGATVITSPVPIGRKLSFMAALRNELKRGRYDILHCHHDLVSGVYLAASVGLPIRQRIVHVHNPDESVLTPSPWKQVVLKVGLRNTCLLLADQIVANSGHSLDVFLAGRPRRPGRDKIHYLGIDPAPFLETKLDRTEFRTGLGLAAETPILLFAGRITPEKNPVFTIDVLAALRRQMPDAVAVFAGDGSLEGDVRSRAAALGQQAHVYFLGWRNDVPQLMSVCDWFILPHPEDPLEGFGIAVVEAQLAGQRLLISKGVSDEPLLPTATYRRLSLKDSPDMWADAAVAMWNGPMPNNAAVMAAFDASPMNMDHALADLIALYA